MTVPAVQLSHMQVRKPGRRQIGRMPDNPRIAANASAWFKSQALRNLPAAVPHARHLRWQGSRG